VQHFDSLTLKILPSNYEALQIEALAFAAGTLPTKWFGAPEPLAASGRAREGAGMDDRANIQRAIASGSAITATSISGRSRRDTSAGVGDDDGADIWSGRLGAGD